MKSPIFHFLILIFLLISLPTGTVGHEEHAPEGATNLVYSVTFTNSELNTWYDPGYVNFIDYQVVANTNVILNVSDISDPQSTYNITIGNLTKFNVADYHGEEVLTVGYYAVPATFGFIANNTWLESQNALNAISPETSNFQLKDFSLPRTNMLGGELHTALIEFSDSFQSTSLLYEQNSGILLKMNSTAGNFNLSLEIQSINDNEEYYYEESTSSTATTSEDKLSFRIFGMILSVPAIVHLHKRIR